MLFEFVSKIGDFLKPRLSRARVGIDKIFKKCFKSGQKTIKMLKSKLQARISELKKSEAVRNASRSDFEAERGEAEARGPSEPTYAKNGLKMAKKASGKHFGGTSSSFYTPERLAPDSVEEFIEVIQHTPISVLSKTDRARIAAVMSFGERKVRDLMAPREKMVFVKEVDLLGPIMLDKLYKSGLTSFPVVDSYRRLKGVLHTEELNALEIKKTDRASKYMDKAIYYLHDNDSLAHAVEEMKQTNNYYFFVVDKEEHLAGFVTVEMILDYFLGE